MKDLNEILLAKRFDLVVFSGNTKKTKLVCNEQF